MDTYLPDYYLDFLDEIKRNSPIPVITLGNDCEYTHNVVNDQEKSLENLIDHLIEVHGCKELVHVAGRLDLEFAQVRLSGSPWPMGLKSISPLPTSFSAPFSSRMVWEST